MKNYTNKKPLSIYEIEAIDSLLQKIISFYEEEVLCLSKNEQTDIFQFAKLEDRSICISDDNYFNNHSCYTIFNFAIQKLYITKDKRFIIEGYIINEDDERDNSDKAYVDATSIVTFHKFDVASLFNPERIERIV